MSVYGLLFVRPGANEDRVCVINVAAEVAAARPDVRGPGTFRAALLDELYNLTPEKMKEMAQIEVR